MAKMTPELLAKMKAGREEAKLSGKKRPPNAIQAIRLKCLDCSRSPKGIKYCTLDGLHATYCPLWPFRFGAKPGSAKQHKMGSVNPKDMPEAGVDLESLP